MISQPSLSGTPGSGMVVPGSDMHNVERLVAEAWNMLHMEPPGDGQEDSSAAANAVRTY